MWDLIEWSRDKSFNPNDVRITSVYHEHTLNSVFITGYIDGTRDCFTVQLHDTIIVTTWY